MLAAHMQRFCVGELVDKMDYLLSCVYGTCCRQNNEGHLFTIVSSLGSLSIDNR